MALSTSLLLLGGCGKGDPVNPCQVRLMAWSASSGPPSSPSPRTARSWLPSRCSPGTGSRYEDVLQSCAVSHGSWSPNGVPLETSSAQLTSGQGVVGVYFNLPGGGGARLSRRERPTRPPLSGRACPGASLRPGPGGRRGGLHPRRPGAPGRHRRGSPGGMVQRGNLAWTTLADLSLELPHIAGVASFETPANGQLATVEPGTDTRPSPLYEEGSCGLDADNALSCDFSGRARTSTGPSSRSATACCGSTTETAPTTRTWTFPSASSGTPTPPCGPSPPRPWPPQNTQGWPRVSAVTPSPPRPSGPSERPHAPCPLPRGPR